MPSSALKPSRAIPHDTTGANAKEHNASPPTPIPSTENLDKVLYLFGYPIAHSLSPLLHRTIYHSLGLNYEQHLYPSQTLEPCLALMQSPKFFGAAVTMPFKVAIIPHLDMLTPEGEAIGAINTVFLRSSPSGKRLLCGTNTDCIGIREAILQNTTPAQAANMKGKPGMVIGGGGTCRAAVYALKTYLECSEVYLVNREPAECHQVISECKAQGFGDNLYYIPSLAKAKSLPAPHVVISAIPDFSPISRAEIETRAIIREFLGKERKSFLLEMCYHPSPDTAIAKIARDEGWEVIEGIEAMIWQGLEQDKVWLRRRVSTLPVEEVKKIVRGKMFASRAKL
ncbi:hypothetical protein HYALB_00003932 [Hymenoscyphus albidus]|uniref:Shikimate dehydrogenase substrate binding N-terminal domain-containing protein n=1 Tax=Hymenoscyphus albidus TaxID=595503 RepID=A0A9N9LYA9_9HELO|nr:hypothetical protein HYALB_00003932 [Hymenoscyphus albidus]